MASPKGDVLLVDDDPDMCELLAVRLATQGWSVTWKTSAAEALEVLASADVDVILTDVSMPDMDGLELCARIVADRPDVPVVMLTGAGNLETAVSAIRAGAYDFITKPPDLGTLTLALRRAVEHRRLREEVKRLRRTAEDAQGLGDLVGTSPVMRRLHGFLARLADSDAGVLVTGESGTGKELVARALHRQGRRGRGPFVAVNCAAVPEALLESELFGHVRGAFTDARLARTGLFVQASGGTLFLDEIGELPFALQPKLLRAVQVHAVRPVGADAEVPCDVRIIAATNDDLESAVEEGRFRRDLYFRIDVVRVEVPPLRERGNDVLLLAQHFIERSAARTGRDVVGLSPAAAKRLLTYPWPGNVRELQNAIERAIALARYERLAVDDLPDNVVGYRPPTATVASGDLAGLVPLEEVERRHILRVLRAVAGNRTLGARILGLDRKTLYRKLERYAAGERPA